MLKRDVYLIIGATRNRWNKRPDGLMMPRIVSAKSKQTPATKAGEVAIRLSIELPESLFVDPSFAAKIQVDSEQITSPQIEADVINNIESLITEATGLKLTLVQEPGTP